MTPRKLNVGFMTHSYGGNGGIASECPSVRFWMIPTIIKCHEDRERIGDIKFMDLADTPLTMGRNRAVEWARENKLDVLISIDSDMAPDCEAGIDPAAKPFWQSSFDYLYEHYDRGPVLIGAPYCGPPPAELPYVFLWKNKQSEHPNPDFQLGMYEREHAASLTGIQECAAIGTGLFMVDLRLFDHTKPPYFYYEYEGDGAPCGMCGVRAPGKQAQKVSTEDVVTTRNLSMLTYQKLGYNPILCNWDAWAGHWKPKLVRKPRVIGVSSVEPQYRSSVLRDAAKRTVENLLAGKDDVSPERFAHLGARATGAMPIGNGAKH